MKDIFCAIGFTTFIASIFMLFPNTMDKKYISLYNILNKEQKKKYMEIIQERIMIYSISTLIAFIVATLYYSKNIDMKYSVCKSISIFSLLQLGIYYFSPKERPLTYSLTTKDQIDRWQDINLDIKNKWKKSIILGYLGYFIIFYSTK